MEGKYPFYPDTVPGAQACSCLFEMTDGGTLVYEDVRKFKSWSSSKSGDQLEAYFLLPEKLGPGTDRGDFLCHLLPQL